MGTIYAFEVQVSLELLLDDSRGFWTTALVMSDRLHYVIPKSLTLES